MDAAPADPWPDITSQLEAARLEFDVQTRRFEEARTRLQTTLDRVRKGRPQRELLYNSAFARLQARLDTMPVIEQAKGVLMAQHRCGPQEAFDLLRRASQRANIKVSVLAAQIVEQVASGESQPVRSLPRPAPAGADTSARGAASARGATSARAGTSARAAGRTATRRAG